MGLVHAFAQLLTVGAILVTGGLYMRHHVATLQRADHSGLEWMEDSRDASGTRYRVVTPAAATGGRSFTVDVVCRSTAPAYLPDLPGSGPEHSHRQAAEHLAVSTGRLGYKLLHRGKETRGELAAGQELDIPAGTSHMLFNADNTTDVAYTLTHRPAGRMGEAFFENLAGLGWEYKSLDRIHPLQVLVLFEGADTQLTDLSGLMAPIVDNLVTPLARVVGFRPHYSSHRSKPSRAAAGAAAAAVAASGDGDGGGAHDEL